MIKIILSGCNGRMGKTISELAKAKSNLQIVAGVDRYDDGKSEFPVYDEISNVTEEFDVVLDFSNVSSLNSLLDFCQAKKAPIVFCTTGYTKEDFERIHECSKDFAVFHSGNMSLGINVLSSVLKKISPILFDGFDIEIIEKHHNQKLDAPSGTALLLADSIRDSLDEKVEYNYGREGMQKRSENEIGIHAVRGGSIVGEHEVIFAGKGEIIELKHTALSREVFAVGALRACEYLAGKKSGLYNMDNVIND